MKKLRLASFGFSLLMTLYVMPLQSCSKYSVTTSKRDPADIYYKKKVAASFFWGIINNPKSVVDTACGKTGLSDVRFTTNVGYSFIHVATLGMVNLVRVEWKCQKEEPVVGYQP